MTERRISSPKTDFQIQRVLCEFIEPDWPGSDAARRRILWAEGPGGFTKKRCF
jgi:hypothetical protein